MRNGEIWRGEDLTPILKHNCQIWFKPPDCGTRTRIDRERWWSLPMDLWLVAVISCGLLDGCLGGSSYFPEAVGLLGTLEPFRPRALTMTPRQMASDLQIPRHNLAHFCCAAFCHSRFRLFLSFPSPTGQCSMQNCENCEKLRKIADCNPPPPLQNGRAVGDGVAFGAKKKFAHLTQSYTHTSQEVSTNRQFPSLNRQPPSSNRRPPSLNCLLGGHLTRLDHSGRRRGRLVS